MPANLKPLLTQIFMPPMFWLLIAMLALLLFSFVRRPKSAGFTRASTRSLGRGRKYLVIAWVALIVLWVLSCHGTAVLLSRWLLPPVTALQPEDLRQLQAQAATLPTPITVSISAPPSESISTPEGNDSNTPAVIIVLGAGVRNHAPEYGDSPALSPTALERLAYGIYLARATGLPLGYSGGMGWASPSDGAPEASAAELMAQTLGVPLAWIDASSRDTHENAVNTAAMLQTQHITHVVLVTQAWHMPRARHEFEAAGLTVIPAPVGFIQPAHSTLLEWLPSAPGLSTTATVLREWLALRVQSLRG